MPFCPHCGAEVGGRDYFCGKCGARQPVAGTPGAYPAGEPVSSRGVSVLCYLPFVGWIAALLVLGSQKYRSLPDVRFHAFQALYLFVAWLLLEWAVVPWFPSLPPVVFPVRKILKLLLVGLSIFMMVKASRDERYSLPLIGELAERSL